MYLFVCSFFVYLFVIWGVILLLPFVNVKNKHMYKNAFKGN